MAASGNVRLGDAVESLLLNDEPIEIVTKQEADDYEQLQHDRHKIQETLTVQDGRFARGVVHQKRPSPAYVRHVFISHN